MGVGLHHVGQPFSNQSTGTSSTSSRNLSLSIMMRQALSAQENLPLPLVKDFYNGVTMMNQSQFPLAAEQMERLARITPAFELARAYWSDALYFSGRWEEALAAATPLTDLFGQQRARLLRRKFLAQPAFFEDARYVLLGREASPLSRLGEEIRQPTGLAINQQGKLWVVEPRVNKVFLAGSNGRASRTVTGTWYAGLKRPIAATSDARGFLYVCTFRDDQVSVFDEKGNHQFSFGGPGKEGGRFFGPRDLVVE